MTGISRRGILVVAAVLAGLRGRAAGSWLGAGAEEVPLEGDGSFWHVRATVNSRERATLLVDTGATLCAVSPAIARRLDLAPVGAVDVRTANGLVRAPLVRLRQLEVGDVRARDLDAVVHDAGPAPLDGILGLNFLNRFHYAVDPRRRVLRLR